jgi:hypothetical protein
VLGSYTQQLLAEAEPPGDYAEILARGEAFIRSV